MPPLPLEVLIKTLKPRHHITLISLWGCCLLDAEQDITYDTSESVSILQLWRRCH